MDSRQEWSPGPIIVGAGPSGLAVAALLAEEGIPSLLLERSHCIASLWQQKTYNRLKLHLPKQFCELPLMPFPSHFPKYPSRQQFVDYLESYAEKFSLRPRFGRLVISAEFEGGLWRVRTEDGAEYVSRWIVVATGENAEPVVPEIHGLDRFGGRILHASVYKLGADFEGEKVLVVGCGNTGMEVSLDLSMHDATPFMVVRDTVHVLPRDILGFSTFGIAMALLKWLPLKVVDGILILAANSTIGSTDRLGLRRPATGPIELKNTTGKSPVLDVGALSAIKAGKIKVMKGVSEITRGGAKFADGVEEEFDSIVLATGYKSNVPSWLKGTDFFTAAGMPRTPFPNGWNGGNGLYTVGFTGRGLLGASLDAVNVTRDVIKQWRTKEDADTPQNFHLALTT